jgi:hypothetical protein
VKAKPTLKATVAETKPKPETPVATESVDDLKPAKMTKKTPKTSTKTPKVQSPPATKVVSKTPTEPKPKVTVKTPKVQTPAMTKIDSVSPKSKIPVKTPTERASQLSTKTPIVRIAKMKTPTLSKSPISSRLVKSARRRTPARCRFSVIFVFFFVCRFQT